MAKVILHPHRQPRSSEALARAECAPQRATAWPSSSGCSTAAAPRCARAGARAYVERVHAKGKLTTWERIERAQGPRHARSSRSAPSSTTARTFGDGAAAPRPAAGVITAFVRVHGRWTRGHRQRQHRRLRLVVAAHPGEDRARPGDGAAPAHPGHLPGRLLGPVPARAGAHLPGPHRRRPHLQDELAALGAATCRRSPACSATASPAAATCRSSPTRST